MEQCDTKKSLKKLSPELDILQRFYQLQPAYRLANDLGVDVKVVTRVYQRFREALYHLCELEACKLKEVTFTDVFKRDGIPIFNHRNEYVIKQFIDIYFGYVSP